MSGDGIGYAVQRMAEALDGMIDRKIARRGIEVRNATVVGTSPVTVRLDGSKTAIPARVRGQVSAGERVAVLKSGTDYHIL